jgi:hypothetical protein
MKFTMDMFEPKSKRKLIGRAGGTSDMGMGIPKDAERHATQAALIQQGGVSREPAILIKFGNGYELLEGWHRTIQHFARYPDGYVGPAYVAVAQSRPGITESMAADQVLDYVKRAHAPEAFDIEYSITDYPKWELKNIPLSQLNLDPDGEEPDPYNRVNWVDDDKVQELVSEVRRDPESFMNDFGLDWEHYIDKDEFIQDVIDTDGYGHTINSYDGSADEITIQDQLFYVMRID